MGLLLHVCGTLQRSHIQRLPGAYGSSGDEIVAANGAVAVADIALSAVCAVDANSSAAAASWDGAKRPDAASQVYGSNDAELAGATAAAGQSVSA